MTEERFFNFTVVFLCVVCVNFAIRSASSMVSAELTKLLSREACDAEPRYAEMAGALLAALAVLREHEKTAKESVEVKQRKRSAEAGATP